MRVEGLTTEKGEIKAQALQRVLGALLKTAECATRLLATGEGDAKGPRPAWLVRTVDFTVTGITPGSTILELDAPLISEVAPDAFEQKDFWRETPQDHDTALDLAALAIRDVDRDDASGERYDASVLDAVMEFKRAVREEGVSFQLIPKDKARGSFELTEATYTRIAERRTQQPEPMAFIVHGKLDEIRHSGGRFRLLMDDGVSLLGRLHVEFLSGESLRPLWGHPATIEGMVHFKLNGQPRFIEARKISAPADGDEIFSSLPTTTTCLQQESLFPELTKKNKDRHGDPMALWGAWPGDEPMEELMALLDRIQQTNGTLSPRYKHAVGIHPQGGLGAVGIFDLRSGKRVHNGFHLGDLPWRASCSRGEKWLGSREEGEPG